MGSLLVQERSMSERQKLSKVVLRKMVMLTKQISYKHAQWMKVSLAFHCCSVTPVGIRMP